MPDRGAPYDAIADAYDAHLAADAWIRERLWRAYDQAFTAGDRVIDFGAGTGIDAEHLVDRGIVVVAVDESGRMLDVLRRRVPGAECHVGGLEVLAGLEPGFDGMVSAFAALNTSPDLRPFAQAAGRLVRTGGRLVLHVLAGTGSRDVMIGSHPVRHWQFSSADLRAAFAPDFLIESHEAVGWVQRVHGRRSRMRSRIDDRLARWPLVRDRGHFHLVVLKRS